MSNEENIDDLARRQAMKAGALISVSPFIAKASHGSVEPSDDELTWLSGVELTKLVANKRISPVEVTRHFLDRIERIDPLINAYITIDAEGALAQAKDQERRLARGDRAGPMQGLPISIKDLVATKGLRTTHGSLIFDKNIPQHDEIQVERLRAAGAWFAPG